ncbi:hypothetical protein A2U01_0116805, partial [Trifolium medium]|nr:hypothetical protein [Trifolium medium]
TNPVHDRFHAYETSTIAINFAKHHLDFFGTRRTRSEARENCFEFFTRNDAVVISVD